MSRPRYRGQVLSHDPDLATVKISVIVAVYNPGRYLAELIASLRAQSMPQDEFEVIFVDDDSTDGSYEHLQRLAREEPNVRVLHNTPNSGWPGKPRNLGLGVARGTYVLFVDNDDWLPAQALEDLYAYAEAHGSDVVVGKEIGHGHTIPWNVFQRSVPDAKLGVDPLLRILTPHKLFRRALLDDHGIRFPEGRVRLEDHLFVMQAYFAARTLSIYADSPVYHWVHRDRSNASLRQVDPAEYYRDLGKVLDVVAENTEPGAMRNALYWQWYSRKILRRLEGKRYLRLTEQDRTQLFDILHALVLERFDDDLDTLLTPNERLRAHLLRTGRQDLVLRLAELDSSVTARTAVDDLHWDGDRVLLAITATVVDAHGAPVLFDGSGDQPVRRLPDELAEAIPLAVRRLGTGVPSSSLRVVLRDRAETEVFPLPGTQRGELVGDDPRRLQLVLHAQATIDPRTARGGRPLPAIADVASRFAAIGWAAEERVPAPAGPAGRRRDRTRTIDGHVISVYATVPHANLSISRDAPQPGWQPSVLLRRAGRRVKRALG